MRPSSTTRSCVRLEYEDEARSRARRQAICEGATGPDARGMVVRRGRARSAPQRVLEVGCGRGELARADARRARRRCRRRRPVGADGRADARAWGRRERRGRPGAAVRRRGVRRAVAAWMLYHVPDRRSGDRRALRVLGPAAGWSRRRTALDHLSELWSLVGGIAHGTGAVLRRETRRRALRQCFSIVERSTSTGRVTFADRDAVAPTCSRRSASQAARATAFRSSTEPLVAPPAPVDLRRR